MITLKIGKAICPVCETSKTQTERFVGKWQLWGSFLLKIKIDRKRKLDSFLFQGENNSKTFKNC